MTAPRSPRWRTPLVIQAACIGAAWVGARLMIGYRALEQDAGPLGASGIFWASAGLLTGAAAVVGSAGSALDNPETPK